MKRAALALLVLATLSGRGVAQGRAEGAIVTSLGAGGRISCGTWLEERRTQRHSETGSWALGYLTGVSMNVDVGNPLRNVDSNGVFYWLDNWCRGEATTLFVNALDAFIVAHRNR
jgi:hypothetical protein